MPPSIEDFLRLQTKPPPPTLYKYRTIKSGLELLESLSTWWSSPLHFNDPVDAKWDIFWSVKTPAYLQLEAELRRELFGDSFDPMVLQNLEYRAAVQAERSRLAMLAPAQRQAELERLIVESPPDPPHVQVWRRGFIRRTRIFCVSEPADSMAMWAHYGDRHAGVAIGLDSSVLVERWRVPPEQVRYRDDPPAIFDPDKWARTVVFGEPPPPNLGGREWALWKTQEWAYEREWRFVRGELPGDSEKGGPVKLPGKAVVSVVLGYQIAESDARAIRRAARNANAECRTVRLRLPEGGFHLISE